jgi:hypothetical protein
MGSGADAREGPSASRSSTKPNFSSMPGCRTSMRRPATTMLERPVMWRSLKEPARKLSNQAASATHAPHLSFFAQRE